MIDSARKINLFTDDMFGHDAVDERDKPNAAKCYLVHNGETLGKFCHFFCCKPVTSNNYSDEGTNSN